MMISYDKINFGKDLYDSKERQETISIPVGISEGKDIYSLKFSCNSDNVNACGMGAVGCGKSSLIHAMILSGSMKYLPKDLEFWLFDFKGNEMASRYATANIPNIKFGQVNKDGDENRNIGEDVYNLLKLVEKEVNFRISIRDRFNEQYKQKLKELNISVDNIADYNYCIDNYDFTGYKRMPRIIVVIDEADQIYDSLTLDYETKYEIRNLYQALLTQGRTSGVHFISFIHKVKSDFQVSFINHTQNRLLFRMDDADSTDINDLCIELRSDTRVQSEVTSLRPGEFFAYNVKNNKTEKVKACYTDNLYSHIAMVREKYENLI